MRSAELRDAVRVRASDSAGGPEALLGLLRLPEVARLLWPRSSDVEWLANSDLFAVEPSDRYVVRETRSIRSGLVVTTKGWRLPDATRLERMARTAKCDEITAVAGVTNLHVVAVRYDARPEVLRELNRVMFVMSEPRARCERWTELDSRGATVRRVLALAAPSNSRRQ